MTDDPCPADEASSASRSCTRSSSGRHGSRCSSSPSRAVGLPRRVWSSSCNSFRRRSWLRWSPRPATGSRETWCSRWASQFSRSRRAQSRPPWRSTSARMWCTPCAAVFTVALVSTPGAVASLLVHHARSPTQLDALERRTVVHASGWQPRRTGHHRDPARGHRARCRLRGDHGDLCCHRSDHPGATPSRRPTGLHAASAVHPDRLHRRRPIRVDRS